MRYLKAQGHPCVLGRGREGSGGGRESSLGPWGVPYPCTVDPYEGRVWGAFSPSPTAGQCSGYCENFGTCQMAANGSRQCRCTVYFEGPKCEVNKCSRCLQGACVVNKQTGDVTCK